MSNEEDWSEFDKRSYIDLCMRQKQKANKAVQCWKEPNFEELCKGLREETGKTYSTEQLLTRWKQLREEWRRWNFLFQFSPSGNGYDPEADTFPPENSKWWSDADKAYQKKHGREAKGKVLQLQSRPNYRKDLDALFTYVHKGRELWGPKVDELPVESKTFFTEESWEVLAQKEEENWEDIEHSSLVSSPSVPQNKRKGKLVAKKKYRTEDLMYDFNHLMTTVNPESCASSTSVSKNSITELMQKARTLQCLKNEDPSAVAKVARIFLDEDRRAVFWALPDDKTRDIFVQTEISKLDAWFNSEIRD